MMNSKVGDMMDREHDTISRAAVRPSEVLRQVAREKVGVFCGTIRENGTYIDPIYKSVQSTSRKIGEDYGNRFLIELIQNGYDAHRPDEESGEVQILLVPQEEAYGVLYVANRGCPFEEHNVQALCNVGLSDKRIGQTIGNKGLGFRSVRYVSDDPQVFSRLHAGETGPFDGFCFRFARGDNFDELVENEQHRRLIKEDSPPFWVPIPLMEHDQRVKKFADDGFATVIRFPLRSEGAREAVLKQIARLKSQEAPVILFLSRLAKLEVCVEDAPDHSFTLVRSARQIMKGVGGKADKFFHVDLGELGRYFITLRGVPEAKVKEAIEQSIQANLLDPDWMNWEGEGELALAIRVDDEDLRPRLYTFLPMGEYATAPFNGYLHAAFFAKVDRRSLQMEVPLNVMYFREAVRLAAHAILALRRAVGSRNLSFSNQEIRCLIVDLLAWEDISGFANVEKRLEKAFNEFGYDLSQFAIIPTLPHAGHETWAPPERVWRWKPSGLFFFTPRRMAEAGLAILDPALGEKRIDSLCDFLDRLDTSPDPNASHLAPVVESIAQSLLANKASSKQWQGFYKGLKELFFQTERELFGREILLGNDGKLHAAPPLGSTPNVAQAERQRRRRRRGQALNIFFPPEGISKAETDEEEEVIKVPKSLQGGLALLEDLDWYAPEMRRARTFLEDAGLVRRYSADNLVDQVAQSVRKSRSNRRLQQALRWVFKLYVVSKKSGRPISLRRARLRVPTVNGKWIQADKAIFSSGWPKETLGKKFDAFLDLTASTSEDLKELTTRRLAGPGTSPFSRKHTDEWTAFLSDIGVTHGLLPIALERPRMTIKGYDFDVVRLSLRLNIGSFTQALWESEVSRSGEQPPYQSSVFELDGSFWYLPGQEVYGQWSMQARLLYAQLIVHWITKAGPGAFSVRFEHLKSPKGFRWPTPLAAFLRRAAWFPIQAPGNLSAEPSLVAPYEVWLPDEDERLPRYLPTVSLEIRRILRHRPVAVDKLAKQCRANVWGAKGSFARQVAYLGRLYHEDVIDPYNERAFANDYRDAWIALAEQEERPDWGGKPRFLVVEKGDELQAICLDVLMEQEDGETELANAEVFVQDTDKKLVVGLLKALRRYVFSIDKPQAPLVASLLRSVLGARYQAVSEVQVEVLIDGQPFSEMAEQLVLLNELCPSLPGLILFAAESLTGPAAQGLPADRTKILGSLRHVYICLAHTISFRVDGELVALPPNQHGAMAIPHPDHPTIALALVMEEPTWDDLHRAAFPLTSLLRHTSLEHPLKLAFRALERIDHPIGAPLETHQQEQIAAELNVDSERIDEVLAPLRGDPAEVLRMLRVVAHYVGGMAAVKHLEEGMASLEAGHEPVEALEPYLKEEQLTAPAVLDACRNAGSYYELLRALDLDFGHFNLSLIALGERPIENREAHQSALLTFIEQHRLDILDRLRQPYIDVFRARGDLSGYIHARQALNTVTPDESWLLVVEIPSEKQLATHIDRWLEKVGAPLLQAPASILPSVEEVKMTNRGLVGKFVKAALEAVQVWCLKNSVGVPKSWSLPEAAAQYFSTALNKIGALDFDRLTDDDFIAWIAQLGEWPAGMPASIQPEALNLAPEDIEDFRRKEREEKLKRDIKNRSVPFAGQLIDPLQCDDSVLSGLLAEALNKGAAVTKLTDILDLTQVKPRQSGRKGKSGGRRRGSKRLRPEQKELIGFLGAIPFK